MVKPTNGLDNTERVKENLEGLVLGQLSFAPGSARVLDDKLHAVLMYNLRLVQEHFDYEQAGNPERVIEGYTDDIVWTGYLREGGPKVVRGKQEAAENYQSIFYGTEERLFENMWRIPNQEYVFDLSKITFTVNVPDHFTGVSPGQKAEILLFHIFRILNGKIREEHVYEMLPGTYYQLIKPQVPV